MIQMIQMLSEQENKQEVVKSCLPCKNGEILGSVSGSPERRLDWFFYY